MALADEMQRANLTLLQAVLSTQSILGHPKFQMLYITKPKLSDSLVFQPSSLIDIVSGGAWAEFHYMKQHAEPMCEASFVFLEAKKHQWERATLRCMLAQCCLEPLLAKLLWDLLR